MFLRKIFILCFVVSMPWSSIAHADWKSEEKKGSEASKVCVEETGMDVDGQKIAFPKSDRLITFKNQNALVHLCWSRHSGANPKTNYFKYLYGVKFRLDAKSDFKILASEGEMMAWGMGYRAEKNSLKFHAYWPNDDKLKRIVRTFEIACDSKCRLIETCEIERKAVDEKDIVSKSKPYLKTAKSRLNFAAGEDKKIGGLMDQLFLEALTGNKEAKKMVSQFREGADGFWGEIVSAYERDITRLEPKNCKWKSK